MFSEEPNWATVLFGFLSAGILVLTGISTYMLLRGRKQARGKFTNYESVTLNDITCDGVRFNPDIEDHTVSVNPIRHPPITHSNYNADWNSRYQNLYGTPA